MGLFYSIMFGIIAAWFIKSLMPVFKGGVYTMILIGIIAGVMGVYFGISVGWGDMSMFNLLQVLLSIALAVVLGYVWGKVHAPKTAPKTLITKTARI